MADPQRIHPVPDPEAPQTPTAPLVPRGSSKSDQAHAAPQDNVYYPPMHRTIPVVHSRPPKRRRSCLCRCLCWTFSVVAILIILIAATAGILYLAFRPKLPKYSIDALQTTQFDLSNNGSLEATFDVTITAKNPNKKIGIYYEGGSRITVLYDGEQLCEGALPKFYQGHRNTTELVVPLSGQRQNGTGLLSQLQAEKQATGVIPLNLRVRQPVRVKLGKLKLFKVKFSVRCWLEVDTLSAGNSIQIKSSSCKFRLRL
ncbi:NDR1/HIN1-like protein 6 [Rhodamnia argentea]|uniref:NDR1/HIN1-like protein 6 n=1 Tax=Rhodamnia argentea TaxID=178133 RepID=A0A8B8N924_9MYRT|nr:NDR1/HIN1-like protein 6 [Rhodamnia argentea]